MVIKEGRMMSLGVNACHANGSHFWQMSQRGGGVQPTARPLPRAHRGGDEHPAALGQAEFVCFAFVK